MLTVATTSWNTRHLIERFLAHCETVGVERVYLMDYESTDGTDEVLHDPRWRSLLRLVRCPGLEDLDASNIMLEFMQEELPSDTIALFCDPDEFLVGEVEQLLCFPQDQGALIIPRVNMTGIRQQAILHNTQMFPGQGLDLEIRRQVRFPRYNRLKGPLSLPPLFRIVPPKVAVRLGSTVEIDGGDHGAISTDNVVTADDGLTLLHHPIRTYEEYQAKAAAALADKAANPEWKFHWIYNRLFQSHADGRLWEEYLEQFVGEADLDKMLANGFLRRNDSVAAADPQTSPVRQLHVPVPQAGRIETSREAYQRERELYDLQIRDWLETEKLVAERVRAIGGQLGLLADSPEQSAEQALVESGAFDAQHYSQLVDLPDNELVLHFVNEGAAAGLSPNPYFDTVYYRNRYLDGADDVPAFVHYCTVGIAAGHRPNAALDPAAYCETFNLDYGTHDPLFFHLRCGGDRFTSPEPHLMRRLSRRSEFGARDLATLTTTLVEQLGVEGARHELADGLGLPWPRCVDLKYQRLSESDAYTAVDSRSGLGHVSKAVVRGGSRLIQLEDGTVADTESTSSEYSIDALRLNAGVLNVSNGVVTLAAGDPADRLQMDEAYSLLVPFLGGSLRWLDHALVQFAAARLAGLPEDTMMLVPSQVRKRELILLKRLYPKLRHRRVPLGQELTVGRLWTSPSVPQTPSRTEVAGDAMRDIDLRIRDWEPVDVPSQIVLGGDDDGTSADWKETVKTSATAAGFAQVNPGNRDIVTRIQIVRAAERVIATDPMDRFACRFARPGTKTLLLDVNEVELQRHEDAASTLGVAAIPIMESGDGRPVDHDDVEAALNLLLR